MLLSDGSKPEAFGKRSRIGYENLFAHMAWRRDSVVARKNWVVIPMFSYPFTVDQEIEYRHVGFFLGTFKDTDPDGRRLPRETLKPG